ncbi:RusA family crossover junction endodeoxyribonuclease [Pantoea sp.]|uniref:RusA family crossover junction endodeoxyribonuclease n=1 Tax=Pantoea sp. TaxID=69393 RepID=UPI00289ECDF4|nr:RusA family crossover junction endodeoxyribonuclease [Pantoea sp.]
MNDYRLELPWPPTVNTYWRHARGRHYISEKGEKYQTAVHSIITAANLAINTTARLRITIDAHAPDKRRRDLDNLLKAVFDSLTSAGFMVDDEQIDDFRVRRREKVQGGKLAIVITELEGTA